MRDLMSTFQVPRDWILLDRTVLLLLGLCTHLHPEMNPMQIIQPYLERTFLGEEGDWQSFIATALKDMARTAISLPDEMHRLLSKANRGELAVQIQGLEKSTNMIYALGHQFLFGMLSLGSGVIGYMARLNADHIVATIAGSAAGLFLLFTLGSILKARRLNRRFLPKRNN